MEAKMITAERWQQICELRNHWSGRERDEAVAEMFQHIPALAAENARLREELRVIREKPCPDIVSDDANTRRIHEEGFRRGLAARPDAQHHYGDVSDRALSTLEAVQRAKDAEAIREFAFDMECLNRHTESRQLEAIAARLASPAGQSEQRADEQMAYVGIKPCGCVVFASIDDPSDPQMRVSNAEHISELILAGLTVERRRMSEARWAEQCSHIGHADAGSQGRAANNSPAEAAD